MLTDVRAHSRGVSEATCGEAFGAKHHLARSSRPGLTVHAEYHGDTDYSDPMPYTTTDGRRQLLDALAHAAEQLGVALASLGEAYELLDEQTADRLERGLFRPVQVAYGRAQRTYTEFAARHDLPTRTFEPASQGAPSTGVKGFIDGALDAAGRADGELAALQDSMLPIEVGDAKLRAGLQEVRELIGGLRGRARELVRTLGR